MLQRTPHTLVYLSAEELSITERERAGLIEVRDDLASGRVKHVSDVDKYETIDWCLDPRASHFSMHSWKSVMTDCGTVHCIGGFMEARRCITMNNYSSSLYSLFYPTVRGSWMGFTPVQAVQAIDHFLAGAGSECWPMALSDEKVGANEKI